ncbi:MAG: glycosyltransferase family 2 protein [Candidatus Marinimicrobia bacterium]|nr:glycosyltransferase family 2 protein [Candidatus Neomarinimicrobiota bacterium]
MNISVIIPTYNRARTIERAMISVMRQTLAVLEIIVVDDCSDDATAEILLEYEDRIKILTNESNRGVSFSRNVGIEAATGEWLAFLDSDDRWDKHKLETQKLFHSANPDLALSQCDEIWLRNGVRVNPMVKHAKQGGWIFEACLPRCIISPSAVIIHKGVFQKVGAFDPHLMACEDYDLWLRIAPFYEIGFLDKKLVTRYGGHEDQLSKKYWGMDRFRITAMEKHLESKLNSDWKKSLIEELVFKCGIVAEGARKRDNPELAERYLDKQNQYRDRLQTEANLNN